MVITMTKTKTKTNCFKDSMYICYIFKYGIVSHSDQGKDTDEEEDEGMVKYLLLGSKNTKWES